MRLSLACLAFALVAASACDRAADTRRPAAEPGTAAEPAKNVVLVVGDALRARNLPFHGYDRATAPFLSELAEDSLVYDNAFSHYSSTWATFSNLFTGRAYSALVADGEFTAKSRNDRGGGLIEANTTLAEILATVGVRARAVSANPYLAEEHGFAQGFEAFHDWSDWDPDFWSSVRKFRAPEVNEVAFRHLDELAAGEGPWLLLLLYFETHNPYQPPAEYRRGLVDPDYPRRDRNQGGGPRDADGETLKYLTPEVAEWYSEEDVAHLTSLYDGEIAAFDAGIRDLVGHLEARGLRDDTVLIVTADHGESLFDRGYWGHGFLSRDEVQHVPLLVANTGLPPRRVRGVAGTSDIFHSLLHHFGAEAPPARRLPWAMDVLRAEERGPVVLSEGEGKTRIVRDARYSFYRHLDIEGRFPIPVRNGDYLFDRSRDPGELDNLLADPEQRERAIAVRDRLLRQAGELGNDTASAEDPFLQGDEERLERLRALGYVR